MSFRSVDNQAIFSELRISPKWIGSDRCELDSQFTNP
ncbi:hypothetical protein C8J23_11357 [Shewanella chilikensis]|uniref:Uncharacterized protein n=1 Tax=Shewanella chilikensis TaxID=558541 RepID=A0ABX5PNQ7_9GAMM|nr:hypothetical protein C8J23_11357 [Shewanella chilikensis]